MGGKIVLANVGAPIWVACRMPPNRQILTFNVELANEDLEIVDKLVEVQKDVRENPPAERPRVGAMKTPVTRR